MSDATFRGNTQQAQLRIDAVDGEKVAWVVLHGEADIATLSYLESALDRVELRDTQAVHIDVSDLDFADVSTVRRLALFAKHAKQTGHRIKTRGASPTLRVLAALLDVSGDLGLP